MAQPQWLGIEIRHMVALAAVARAGSFRVAAEQLGYVQSAISQQVAQLERLTGHRLVERARGSRDVRLTEAGELLLEHVDTIVTRFRAAEADVGAIRDADDGELRIGFFGGLVLRLLPALGHALARTASEMRLVPIDAVTDRVLLEQLRQGSLDAAFVELPVPPGEFAHISLADDPWVLLTQARPAPPPSATELLARSPLIVPTGSRSFGIVQAHLTAHGLDPRVAIRTESEITAQALAGAGVGVAILPRLAVDETDPRVAMRSLPHELPRRTLALCWLRRREHIDALRRLGAVASTLARQLVEPLERDRDVADDPTRPALAA